MQTTGKIKIASIICASTMAISVFALSADSVEIGKTRIFRSPKTLEPSTTAVIKNPSYMAKAVTEEPENKENNVEEVADFVKDVLADSNVILRNEETAIRKAAEAKAAAEAKKKEEEEKKAREATKAAEEQARKEAEAQAAAVEVVVYEEEQVEEVEEEPADTEDTTSETTETEKPAAAKTATAAKTTAEDDGLYMNPIIDPDWNSSGHLTTFSGVYYGPSGKETYYNLNMSGVVSIMRNMGFDEENYPYWVREDGCKMLGNYIMVAADLSVRKRGTLVETSLGTALVCDTGSFAASNHNQIDIATNW